MLKLILWLGWMPRRWMVVTFWRWCKTVSFKLSVYVRFHSLPQPYVLVTGKVALLMIQMMMIIGGEANENYYGYNDNDVAVDAGWLYWWYCYACHILYLKLIWKSRLTQSQSRKMLKDYCSQMDATNKQVVYTLNKIFIVFGL